MLAVMVEPSILGDQSQSLSRTATALPRRRLVLAAIAGSGLVAAGIQSTRGTISPSLLADVEPAATPGAATPTADTPRSITVRLDPGLGNDWCIYNGQTANPGQSDEPAVQIAGVRNRAGKRITLNYWDSSGRRVGPVAVSAGAVTHEIDGHPAAGTWEAAIGGSGLDAPNTIELEITYVPTLPPS